MSDTADDRSDEPRDAPREPAGTTLHRWEDIPTEAVTPALGRKLVTGERMMLAQVFLDEGCVVPKHSHENEQLTWVVEGALRFKLGDDGRHEVVVRAGEVLHIPSNVPHEAIALEDTLDVDIFSPPRADWLDGSDTYFHDTARE